MSFGAVTKGLDKITEKMSTSKFIKGAKGLSESVKNISEAVPGIGALVGLLMTVIDATGLLKPFEAVFQVILGLFGILGAQIIPVLMEAIRPLIQTMLQMIPIWIFVGQILAVTIQIALIPFTIQLEIFKQVMLPLMPIFEELNPVLVELHPLISELTEVLMIIVPPLVFVIQLMLGLDTGINALITPIGLLNNALGTIEDTFDDIEDTVDDVNDVLEDFIGWIKSVASAASDATGGAVGGSSGGGGDDDDWWPFW